LLTKKTGNLDFVAPSSVQLFANYSFNRNVTVTFSCHVHRLVIQVYRLLIVNALYRCAGDEFMKAGPPPPRFTHLRQPHPVFPYRFSRKPTTAPVSVSDATGFVFRPSVFPSIKSPTLELKTCICALVPSI
jgi:hypothetical protein